MELLLKQIVDNKFKPSNFTVYSILDEEGFIIELEGMFNTKILVDDLEYMLIELTTKEKNGILYRMSFMTDTINELKELIEKKIQDNPLKSKSLVYVDKTKPFIFIAKLKDFNLQERVVNIIKSDQTVARSLDIV